MCKALVVLADGFEDVEAVAAIDVLRRGGAHVDVASCGGGRVAVSAHGLRVEADGALADFAYGAYGAIILPGGGKGTENLMASGLVTDLLRRQRAAGRLVCAICAAPAALAAAGVLDGAEFTCYPGVEERIGREPEAADVVADGATVTGRGPAAAVKFALAVLARLVSPEAARAVADGMLVPPGERPEGL